MTALPRILLLFFVLWLGIAQGELAEEDILNSFLKMGFEEEEYGYVLEGIKPISIRDFYSFDEIPVYKDFKRFEKEFLKTLLVRSALPIWKKYFEAQSTFVLKGIPLNLKKPATTGFEVQFINVPKLKEVIEKNIDLFRYALGPSWNTEDLVQLIAFSESKMVEILKDDSVLIGIVLGYGSYNSLMGGRSDMIINSFLSRDTPPLAAKSYCMQLGDESVSFFPATCYGSCYLDFAGGKEQKMFQQTATSPKTDSRFSNAKEELLALSALEELLPPCLHENQPGFVFGPYKGGGLIINPPSSS